LYVLKFTSEAVADIKSIVPKHLRGPMQKELVEKVATDPIGCSKELQRELSGYRSFTSQKYRVVYRVFDELLAKDVRPWLKQFALRRQSNRNQDQSTRN
jgi:mRNA-degrading endonuclease RelE of RelBE toxin-antitoxin system